MDATCWKVVGGMGVAVLALAGVVRILWGAYRKAQADLLESKEQRIRELEELRKIVEARRPGGAP